MKHWGEYAPIVIVPTKYPAERFAKFAVMGVHNFIFSNHSLCAVIVAY